MTENERKTKMDDLIKRQGAIELIKNYCENGCDIAEDNWCPSCQREQFIELLKALPSAQQWIPCSEGVPEERNWYLGIFREPDTGWTNPLPFVCDYLLGTKTKATTKEGWILRGFTDRDEHIDYYFNLECVAWMPLPEPYEEEK